MNINDFDEMILLSPIRTGSTFVYNILRRIFNNVNKTHYERFYEKKLYFMTIRHPYNSIISKALVFDEEINLDTIIKYTKIYLETGGTIIVNNNLDKPNIILFYYEDFFDNPSNIFKIINEKLGIKIDEDLQKKLIEEFNINNMQKIANNYKDFDFYDRETHIHGNHISKYKGETDYKKILSLEEINYLKSNNDLNIILEKYYS
jgi:hypothetical protein